MPRSNTDRHYGSVTKTFHWLTALLILSAFPLGYFAHEAPYATGAELALKANLFSLHKTIGIAAFFTALLRILWALGQRHPALLNADNKLEAFAAQMVHWMLFGAMVMVPLSGWIHHAATEGFAPIWWPFGQDLPFIPKSQALADLTGGLHFVLMIVLALSLAAHIGGALKHFVIDRDKTLQRMLPGTPEIGPLPAAAPSRRPMLTALIIWLAAIGIDLNAGAFKSDGAPTEVATLSAVQSDWAVQSGKLSINIMQFGQAVTGEFADWTADIQFEDTLTEGRHGKVTVTISIGSLSLGSVTQQAMGRDYFNVAEFPTATFAADILPADEGYLAEGTLTLRGVTMPLSLPFDLENDGRIATMRGGTQVNRLDFNVGANQPDEGTLGFPVDITVELTATRG